MPKITRREFAKSADLKLNQLKHLRRNDGDKVCCRCHALVSGAYFFVELAWRELPKPIQTDNFVLTRVQVPILRYCIPCSRQVFPQLYRKICRNGVIAEGVKNDIKNLRPY